MNVTTWFQNDERTYEWFGETTETLAMIKRGRISAVASVVGAQGAQGDQGDQGAPGAPGAASNINGGFF